MPNLKNVFVVGVDFFVDIFFEEFNAVENFVVDFISLSQSYESVVHVHVGYDGSSLHFLQDYDWSS